MFIVNIYGKRVTFESLKSKITENLDNKILKNKEQNSKRKNILLRLITKISIFYNTP